MNVLRITAINVGYGDAFLLEESRDNGTVFRMLIDGGSAHDTEFCNNATGRIRAADYLARAGITSLDILVITHVHEDHICGLEPFIMKGGRVRELWTSYVVPPEHFGRTLDARGTPDTGCIQFIAAANCCNRVFQYLTEQGCIIKHITGSLDSVPLSGNFKVDILSPSERQAKKTAADFDELYHLAGTDRFGMKAGELDAQMNAFSMVLRLNYGGKKILLPGDACPSPRLMEEWAGRMDADILKLAHHGQRDSVNEPFIRAVSPRIVLTSSSSDRRYNSAHPEVYRDIGAIMEKAGVEPAYLFTDQISLTPCQTEDRPRAALVISIDHGVITWALQPV
jgi:competence protein ComEC